MSKAKAKPRYGYENIIKRSRDLPFSKDQLQRIWDTLNPQTPHFTLNDLQEGLRQAIGTYNSLSTLSEDRPTRDELAAALDEIAQKANDLATLLNRTDDITKRLLGNNAINHLEEESQRVNFLATLALTELRHKKPKTKPYNFPLKGFFIDLVNIYKTATGRSAGISRNAISGDLEGPLFRFVNECVTLIQYPIISSEGIYSHIRNAIKFVRNREKADLADEENQK